MVETRPFKTKLCLLYKRGRCARETCTFAHGDSELRRRHVPDRRVYRGNDLRSKLGRKRSPIRRFSAGRDLQGSSSFKRFAPSLPGKRRKLRAQKEHKDVAIDSSSGFRSPDGTPDSTKDKKHPSANSRTMIDDELKQVQYEIDMLLDENSNLEIELEQREQEADILSSRIRDLEAQLSEEKDKSKRVNSKIKKFVRAHVHHSRLQDEIKRSQLQLEQLVGKLGINAVPVGEDKLNVSITSDEDILGFKGSGSPVRKQRHSSRETLEGSQSENKASGNIAIVGSSRKSLVHSDVHQKSEVVDKRNDATRSSNKSKARRRNSTKVLDPLNKEHKSIELNHVVPPTSMAAHAIDDFGELVEEEENHGVVGNPKSVEKVLPVLPPPPPLPIVSQNSYSKDKDNDENVNVDGHEEEFEEVDIV